MLSILSIVYLFSGGVGAGVIFVTTVLGFAWSKSRNSIVNSSMNSRIVSRGYLAGVLLLVFGTLCLLFDLGRIDRIIYLFVATRLSFVGIGAWALLILDAVSGFLLAVCYLQFSFRVAPLIRIANWIAILVSIFVMCYTGLLLSSMVGVALWTTWLIPMLFLVSSLSAGIALVMLIIVCSDMCTDNSSILRTLSKFDIILLAIELFLAGGFLLRMSLIDNSSMLVSKTLLLSMLSFEGQLWWIGFIGIGVILPLIVEIWVFRLPKKRTGNIYGISINLRNVFALIGIMVLLGALCMRFALANAGTQRDFEVSEVTKELISGDNV